MRLIAIAALVCGCTTPRHLFLIEPLTEGKSPAAAPSLLSNSAKEPVREIHPEVGNWFARQVFLPEAPSTPYAVEIIYCPTEKPIFSECRIAVAWSRNGKGGLGREPGAPPSPVADNDTGEDRAAVEGSAAPRSAMAGGPSGVVEINGRTLFDLPGAEVAKLRGWAGATVVLTAIYGKAVSGRLLVVEQTGLSLNVGDKSAQYLWNEIRSVAAAQ